MKLKNIIYGMMCVAALGSCSDKMEYHEYNNYDEDFVKLNFGNVGGLITNIYLSMDVDFGTIAGQFLVLLPMSPNMLIREIRLKTFTMVLGVRRMLKVACGRPVMKG